MSHSFRHTLRRLARTPMFTGITVLTLAIGIGANAAIFSVINGVLLKPLPYFEHERLVGVWHTAPGINIKLLNASPSTYFTYKDEKRVFEDVALWDDIAATVTQLGEPERVDGLSMTAELFAILRVQPALGRLFTAKDDQPGSPETVILSDAFWRRKFGGNASAVGKTLLVDGSSREIIGVLPATFRFLDQTAALFLPMRIDRAKEFAGHFSFYALARLKPGATLEQANADVARMLPMMLDKFPMPPGFSRKMFEDARIGPNVRPLKAEVVGDIGTVLWVLMGTVGIVLLIACANVANLFLVRAEGRQQELAVRAALGASWGKLARELLGESIGLALVGGVLGVGLAYAGIQFLVSLAPANLPRLSEISINAPVVAFTLLISVVAGMLFGLIPVFRFAGRHLGAALKEGGRGASDGKSRNRARGALVVAQVALALVLLVSAGLMMRTFQAMRDVNPGFVRPAEILTLRVSIPSNQVKDDEQAARTYEQIAAKVREIPGVTSVGLTSGVTMDGNNSNDPVFVEEFPIPEGQIPPLRRFKWIGTGYFATMGNPLLAGRDFTWPDIFGKLSPVIISESLARQYWKNPGDALGKRVRESPKSPWHEIIGVAGNERDAGVHQPAAPTIYWPMVTNAFWDNKTFVNRYLAYAIRSPRTGTPAFRDEIRQAVWAVNPSLAITSVRTVQRLYERSMARTSFTLVMLGIASAMALLLGLIGIYGVISYSVSQRQREIGIRMALGAQSQQVRTMFVRQGFLLTAIGIVLGLCAAAALTRAMSGLLFEVKAIDPLTYGAVSVGLIGAAVLASYLPARRATTVDPVRALRSE